MSSDYQLYLYRLLESATDEETFKSNADIQFYLQKLDELQIKAKDLNKEIDDRIDVEEKKRFDLLAQQKDYLMEVMPDTHVAY